MKKQLIQHIARRLAGYGFDVYLSDDGEHGFYTDGVRVVSFGGHWRWSVDFSGNYRPTPMSGTGWQIAHEQTDISREQAERYINTNAPAWANREPVYTTPAQHLATYGRSSGYQKFINTETVEG